jgi:Uma2 family endonuclease
VRSCRRRGGLSARASRGLAEADRNKKLPIYAAHGVSHVWLIDPTAKTLEVHSLGDDRRWRDVRVYEGDARVRAEPFAAIELDLASLWVR